MNDLGPHLAMLAATLDDRAERIDALAAELEARASTATWRGPAADRFRVTVAERRHTLRAAAEALRAAAHQARLLSATVLS